MSGTWNGISHLKQTSDFAAALFADWENKEFYGSNASGVLQSTW